MSPVAAATGPGPWSAPRLDLGPALGPPTGLGHARPGTADAMLTEVDGRTVAWFRVGEPGSRRDGAAEADVVERALAAGIDLGIPVVGVVHSIGMGLDALDGLAGWGRVARCAVRASGVVPVLVAVTGPCHGGLAPLLGLADHVVVTRDATAYINGPRAVAAVTGWHVDPVGLGGPSVHATASGLASFVAADEDEALAVLADLLGHLPDNWLAEPPMGRAGDPADRPCRAGRHVPSEPRRSYDVRTVLGEVLDRASLLEVRAHHAPNLVTAYGRVMGRSVAVVANQPAVRAGTIDIAASSKAARHVQGADAAGLPLLTFVDTPGFEPGRDLEWRGMIRHGAELVHAYAAATVPRICVVLRKAFGGAYIVMDSKSMGSDLVLAWPGAQIAVMGAAGAVEVLHRRDLAAAEDPGALRAELEARYESTFLTPRLAADRGYVDEVIDPSTTRVRVAAALARLHTKQPRLVARKHSNTPL
ncbi:MAG: methylmalonyl-CoA carboxyltransferase [Actinobacteria bacterium]|nr:methylmalonyl-CoA carboxyltransferase [Actinomycetota bacterium]